ncbi:hypothetical protein PHET_05053 [Paragonimus heterotremus]|uniref:Uncharacterized protein n=1 Tax=Paragonimus heterotremus TaxID=100268 RepID=A0A8J4SYK6_9TREM|nr:hypothetical protein PHET_05053 [Paragonimus heterotremus]
MIEEGVNMCMNLSFILFSFVIQCCLLRWTCTLLHHVATKLHSQLCDILDTWDEGLVLALLLLLYDF